jgi:hypothetical protein
MFCNNLFNFKGLDASLIDLISFAYVRAKFILFQVLAHKYPISKVTLKAID